MPQSLKTSRATQPAPKSEGGEGTEPVAPENAELRLPDASDLQDRMPEHLKFSRQGFCLAVWLCLIFLLHSYVPRLWYTDLWGHLAYGRVIWAERAIPATEPLMPLAEGMEFIDTAWLSQVVGFGMMQTFGITSIQFLYSLCITITVGMIATAVFRRTDSLWAAIGSSLLLLFVENQPFYVVRPQLAGVACFAITLIVATQHRFRWWAWAGLPLMFAAWANLHGSFIVGLMVLGAMLVGRVWDVWRRSKSIRAAVSSGIIVRLFLMLQLCAVACLLNPYGLALYTEVLTFSRSPNLADLMEWEPLTLRSNQGMSMAVLALILMACYRFSPRRISGGEALLVIGFGVAALWSSRMLVWWGPVAAYYAAIHMVACWRAWRGRKFSESPRGGLWTISTFGIVWIAFAFTPFGYRVIHGEKPTNEERWAEYEARTSPFTPHEVVDWLYENPVEGQIFNSYEWGDYLIWAGPEDLQVFVASHAHLVPPEVWRDYMATITGEGDWEMNLRRYGVNTVVLSKLEHEEFIAGLRDKPEEWEFAYQGRLSAIFIRKNPL